MNFIKGNSEMSSIESALGVIVAKIGWLKLGTLAASLVGALVMVMFRPPKTRKEVFQHALVAGIGSYLFGPFCVSTAVNWFPWGVADLNMPVHFLVGALSWGVFSGLATWREKLAANPKEAIQDVTDIV